MEILLSSDCSLKVRMGEQVVPGVEEALALDPRSGVRRIKRRLTIR